MKVEIVKCDGRDCGKSPAKRFQVFSHRRPDGAGGMENLYYQFDLCPDCLTRFVNALLDSAMVCPADARVLDIFKNLNIVTRTV